VNDNPLLEIDPSGLISLVPGNTSKRCRKRWLNKVLPQLKKAASDLDCSGYFCRELKTDLQTIISDVLPLLVVTRESGGSYRCGRDLDPKVYEVVQVEPFAIQVGRSLLCGSVRDALHTVLHEAAHFADCQNNADSFKDEEEGCGAEVACFGFSIGNNCRDRGYPFKR